MDGGVAAVVRVKWEIRVVNPGGAILYISEGPFAQLGFLKLDACQGPRLYLLETRQAGAS